jgi:hypothetical protein
VITLDDEYRLDIALYMNRRVLIKHGGNLYSYSVQNHENRTLVLQTGTSGFACGNIFEAT